MKSTSSTASFSNIASTIVCGLAAYATVVSYQNRQSLFNDADLTTKIGEFQSLRSGIDNIAEITSHYKPFIGERKIFLEESHRVFNVIPFSEMQFDDGLEQALKKHDPRTDYYYTMSNETIEIHSELYAGYHPSQKALDRISYAKWCGKEMGYGLFANIDLPEGAFLGEFTGLLTGKPVPTDYMWTYATGDPGKEDGNLGVDSRHSGNLLRFSNDVEHKLNVRIVYLIRDNMWRMAYVTTQPVRKDEELYISYGPGYWQQRKYFDPDTQSYKESSSAEDDGAASEEVAEN